MDFLRPRDQYDMSYIRTDKPPKVAYSVFGNAKVKYQLKRIAADREMLRGDITDEVVNTTYADGPTREQFRFLDQLEPWEKYGLTDAGYTNPSPELLAKVEARNERSRLIGEEAERKERDWQERGEADIQRSLRSFRNHNPDAISDDVWPEIEHGIRKKYWANWNRDALGRTMYQQLQDAKKATDQAGHSYSEKANYRHLASQGVQMYVDIVRDWPDAESKAVIAEIDAPGRKDRNDE